MQTHAIPAGKLILRSSEYAHDREKWLNARRSGLGASEVAAVLGLSPWSTPYKVWRDKVSSEPPVELRRSPSNGDMLMRRRLRAVSPRAIQS